MPHPAQNIIKDQNGKYVIKIENRLTDEFCLSYECVGDECTWGVSYSACFSKPPVPDTAKNTKPPPCNGSSNCIQSCYSQAELKSRGLTLLIEENVAEIFGDGSELRKKKG